MKITNDEQPIKGYPTDKPARLSENSQADFSSILENTLATTHTDENEAQKPGLIENVMPLQLQNVQPAQKPSTIDHIENMLDLLDEYRHKLADPNSTLKDIHPLVESLEAANKPLIPVLDSIVEDDRLKQILNEPLVTTSTEVIKYNKGEYI